MLLVAGGTAPDGVRADNGQAVVVPPPEPAVVSPAVPKAKAVPAPAKPAVPEAKTVPGAVSSGGPAGKGAPAAPPVPAAAPTPAPPYRYQAEGKADPFVPFIELDLAAKKLKEEALRKRATLQNLPVSPLQQADIGRFHLVGIAGDDHRRMAIVEDGVAKKYYPLFVGTKIGMNGGQVVSILPDRVIVEERLQDPTNKVRKAEIKRSSIMLRKEEGRP